MRQITETEIEVMAAGVTLPERSTKPKNWSRRAIHRELKIAIDTLYKWEFAIHSNLLKLPHSFRVWEFIIKQEGAKKVKRPPLDDYQIECLFLLGRLRGSAATNTTIEQTIKDNGAMFYELHQMYSPLHTKED